MSQYVLEQGRRFNPTALARHPYRRGQGWPAQLLTPNASTFVAPGSPQLGYFGAEDPWAGAKATGAITGGTGGTSDNSALIKGLLLVAAAIILWKLITPGVSSNPGGKNKVASVFKGAGGWFYKLARKRARRRGPFSSHCAAVEAAERRGYSVVE